MDGLRFLDILTTASAVANYLGQPDVTPAHVREAISLLREEKTLDDLGRPLSPLVRRGPPGSAGGADARVRALAQRWYETLGSRPDAELSPEQLRDLIAELDGLADPPA